jgi:predicted GNAT family N-acyltransferase
MVRRVEFLEMDVGSALHASQQRLRDEVLRKPLGRALSSTEIERDRTGVHFVALDGEEVVACVGLYPEANGLLRLRQMAVAPALQGQGVGARLLAFAEQWARESDAKEIEMHARIAALGFYERSGYLPEGAAFEEHGIPHIVMRKRL